MTDQRYLDQANNLRDRIEELTKKKSNKPLKSHKSQLIAIASGKGGVGKSHVSINLATCLAQNGSKVLLFDADYGLGNIDILLGLSAQKTLVDVLTEGSQIRETIQRYNKGFWILSSGSGYGQLANMNNPTLNSLLNEVTKQIQNYDYVIIDTGAGISDRVINTLVHSDTAVIVTTPEPTSLTDSYATIKMVSGRSAHINYQVVVNMASSEDEANDIYNRLNMVSRKYLGVTLDFWGAIPKDHRVVEATRRQKPLVECYPSSPAALSFMKLASKLNDRIEVPQVKQSVQSFFKSFLMGKQEVKNSVMAVG